MARRRIVRNAQLNAFLKYGPEEDVLKAAIRQAYENRHTAVRQAHGQAQGVIGAVNDTLPAARHIYRDQATQQATAKAIYGNDIAALSNVAGSIQAGAALERQNATDALAQSRSATLTGLTQQRVSARAGEQFATAKARSDFVGAIRDILEQKKGLAQRKGAFTASEIDRLAGDAADRRIDLRRITETTRHNKVSEGISQQNANSSPKGAGRDLLSPEKHLATADLITDIESRVRKYPDLSRPQIAKKLVAGRPAQRITIDPDTGEKLDNPVTLPAIPAYKANIAMTAALDIALDGHLSRATAARMRRLGFSLKQLGLPTYKQWRKEHPLAATKLKPGTSGTLNLGGGGVSGSGKLPVG